MRDAIIFIFAVLIGYLVAYIAKRKSFKRPFWFYWFLGTLFNWIALLVVIFIKPSRHDVSNSSVLPNQDPKKDNGLTTVHQNNTNSSSSLVKTDDIALTLSKKKFDFHIPPEVVELLWFGNGPYQNYDSSQVKHTQDVGMGFVLEMYITSDIEPSLINIDLPIKRPKDPLFVGSLSYFPSFASISPEQRWCYLTWLTNTDVVVDIGYVFLYYYGLERHLFVGNVDQAFNEILKLRRRHQNNSFEMYSLNALMGAILFHKRVDLYETFLNTEGQNQEWNYSDIHLYIKHLFATPLHPRTIIGLSSHVDFTNKRYVKAHPELFERFLAETLKEKYDVPALPLEKYDHHECPSTKVNIVANTSLEPRYISIPQIIKHKKLCKDAFDMLQQTHEKVKVYLKNERKKA